MKYSRDWSRWPMIAGVMVLQPLSAGAASTSSRSSSFADAAFSTSDGCQRRQLSLELSIEVDSPATGATIRNQFTFVSLDESNWCTGTSKSFTANWGDVSSLRIGAGAQSASVQLQRDVNLTECSYVDGVPNCTSRMAPLSLSAVWSASGAATTQTYLHQTNVSGSVQRSFNTSSTTQAQLSYAIALDGTQLTLGPASATLSSNTMQQGGTP